MKLLALAIHVALCAFVCLSIGHASALLSPPFSPTPTKHQPPKALERYQSHTFSKISDSDSSLDSRLDSRELARRWSFPSADDVVWNRVLCNANKLATMMKATNAGAAKILDTNRASAQSEFVNIKEEMKKWGYHSYPPAENTDMAVLGIEDALAALGLSTKMQRNDGPVQPLNFVHEDREQKDENGDPVPREKQTYVVDGRTYKMTRALCQMMVDHEGGAIYTSYRVAAYNAAKRMWRPRVADPPKDQLPKLRSMSDLMYAGWIWDDGVPAAKWKEIKYLFSNQITNADTNEVIMRVLKSKGMKDLPQWPGVTFPITDVEGQALLGTPNAVGYGYLLAQHKDQLGNKCVTKITAFEKRGDAHMLLYVEDCVAKDPLEKSLQHGGAGEGKEVMGVVTTVDLGDGTGISPIEQ